MSTTYRSISLGIFLSLVLGSIAQVKKSDSTLKELTLDDVVVTAQYAPTNSKEALFDVRVIQGEEIRRQGQLTLTEVLTNQLNLRVSADPILGDGLSIQGLGGQNVQIMIDGVPVIGRVGGDIDLSQINLQNVERIEIIEGAMSAQYGSNASGGVVNIITKKVSADAISIEAQNQWESIGISNHSVGLGLRIGDFSASASAYTFISQFANSDSLRTMVTDTLESGQTFERRLIPWNPKEQLGLSGTLRYYLSDS
ncbi:MAG: TonB-dependent receptor plug domain-containing protein, partial [Bacteroidota bacterium]